MFDDLALRPLAKPFQVVLDALPETPVGAIKYLLGDLESLRIALVQKLNSPQAAPAAHDQLLSVDDAAERLGMSRNYLYRNSQKFPFTRHVGRSVRFSSLGIDSYIQKDRLTARQQKRTIGTA
jgi:excisionase family DNA binding protein